MPIPMLARIPGLIRSDILPVIGENRACTAGMVISMSPALAEDIPSITCRYMLTVRQQLRTW